MEGFRRRYAAVAGLTAEERFRLAGEWTAWVIEAARAGGSADVLRARIEERQELQRRAWLALQDR